MDQMEENEIELESVVIDSTTDSGLLSESVQPRSDNGTEELKAEKLVRFPLTRVKHLVKMDPDVNLCSQEALFLITKATVRTHKLCVSLYLEAFKFFIYHFSLISSRPLFSKHSPYIMCVPKHT